MRSDLRSSLRVLLVTGTVAAAMACGGDDTKPVDTVQTQSGDGGKPDGQTTEQRCGNGVVESGEQCDDGSANSDTVPGACRTSCRRAWCGDGVLDNNEECDGVALGSKTCATEDFSAGTLACSASCKLDTSGCSTCGNGTREGDETCDGDEMGSATCATVAGKQHGVVTCKSDCSVDTSKCYTCGNGTVENPAEVCEPGLLGGETCASKNFAYGTLVCSECVRVDDAACRSFCGNGVMEEGEQCDRDDLPATTCAELNKNFPQGEVTCAPSCMLSALNCHRCGNGKKDDEEECDGGDLGGVGCDTLWGGGSTGKLGCTSGCKFDTSLCVPANTCGNGTVDENEHCDGDNLGGKTCADLKIYGGGHLSCSKNCLFDTSDCLPVPCGNGKIDAAYGELCDGTNLAGASCIGLGFGGGTLSCTPWCTYDMSQCEPRSVCGTETDNCCGNQTVESGEECDTYPPQGLTCQALGFLPGGNIQCSSNCLLDVSNCARCGDNRLDWDEACDTDQLRGLTCSDFGMFGGELSCKVDCTFDTSRCDNCGNGVAAADEECDGADFKGGNCATFDENLPEGNLVCQPQTCTIDSSMCHKCLNGKIEGPETCDPIPVQTCEDLQFNGGLTACSADCLEVDTSGCWKTNDGICATAAGETLSNSPEDCGWKDISAGYYNTCGVKNDGALFCWGGYGTLVYPSVPTRITFEGSSAKVVQVSVGVHICALMDDSTVRCWGGGNSGQLGNGTDETSIQPVQVSGLAGVAGVVAGYGFSCAWQTNGAVWCWGSDGSGTLGNGLGQTDSNVPVLVSGTGQVVQLSAGRATDYSGVIARRADGSAVGWGYNGHGGLGLGSGAAAVVESALSIAPLGSGNTLVASGGVHTCVARANGSVACSGYNVAGRLGTSDTTSTDLHVPVDTSTGLVEPAAQIAAGGYHTCVRTSNGVVWCWGRGQFGALGIEASADFELSPVRVSALTLPASKITASFANNGDYTCAILSDGSAWCWGYGGFGQLGNAQTSNQTLPVRVIEPTQ